jgi:hypothetical protein
VLEGVGGYQGQRMKADEAAKKVTRRNSAGFLADLRRRRE